MRPPRRVLMIGNDSDEIAALRFVLKLRYFVAFEEKQEEFFFRLATEPWDAVVLVYPPKMKSPLETKIKKFLAKTKIGVLVIFNFANPRSLLAPEGFLFMPRMSGVLTGVKKATAKPRGLQAGSEAAMIAAARLRTYWEQRKKCA